MIVERIDSEITRWSKVGALLLLGWFASSAYHGTLSASKAIKAVPVLQAQAGCEHWVARKATELAKQPVVVDPKEIPTDNCAHIAPHQEKQ